MDEKKTINPTCFYLNNVIWSSEFHHRRTSHGSIAEIAGDNNFNSKWLIGPFADHCKYSYIGTISFSL